MGTLVLFETESKSHSLNEEDRLLALWAEEPALILAGIVDTIRARAREQQVHLDEADLGGRILVIQERITSGKQRKLSPLAFIEEIRELLDPSPL